MVYFHPDKDEEQMCVYTDTANWLSNVKQSLILQNKAEKPALGLE